MALHVKQHRCQGSTRNLQLTRVRRGFLECACCKIGIGFDQVATSGREATDATGLCVFSKTSVKEKLSRVSMGKAGKRRRVKKEESRRLSRTNTDDNRRIGASHHLCAPSGRAHQVGPLHHARVSLDHPSNTACWFWRRDTARLSIVVVPQHRCTEAHGPPLVELDLFHSRRLLRFEQYRIVRHSKHTFGRLYRT